MNGHSKVRMDTILRQCEAPVRIYDSKGFPASNYRFEWSFIAGQVSNMKRMTKIKIFFEFDLGFSYRSRGSRGLSGRVQNRSQSLKMSRYACFQNIFIYSFLQQSIFCPGVATPPRVAVEIWGSPGRDYGRVKPSSEGIRKEVPIPDDSGHKGLAD